MTKPSSTERDMRHSHIALVDLQDKPKRLAYIRNGTYMYKLFWHVIR